MSRRRLIRAPPLLAGVASAFDVEANETVDLFEIDGWVIGSDARGPFLGATPLPNSAVSEIAAIEGVSAAAGLTFANQSIEQPGGPEDVNLLGAEPDGIGMPAADVGTMPTTSGEVAVSSQVGAATGDLIVLGGDEYEVVGILQDSSALAGTPNVVVALEDSQALAFAGQPIVTSIAVNGAPQTLPDRYRFVDRAVALDDLIRPIEAASGAITLLSVLLWIIAGSIMASVIYLSVLERQQDFAVFKATGWANGSLLAGLVLQAAILALLAAGLAILLAIPMAQFFPLRVQISTATLLFLPALALGIGLLASAVGLRQITAIDPAEAFA